MGSVDLVASLFIVQLSFTVEPATLREQNPDPDVDPPVNK